MIDEHGRNSGSGNKVQETAQGKLMNRLQGILAMTKSPNENEAALAMDMLNKFLTQHNLSIADLEKKGAGAPPVGEQRHDLGKAAFKWKLDLAEGIAEFYYCIPMVDRRAKTVSFVGRPDNVEALQLLYGWVIDQIKNISRDTRRAHFDSTGEHVDPLRWQLQFGEGIVPRLVDRLKEMKARQSEDLSRDDMGNVTALAIHHASEASDYLEKEYGYRRDGKKTAREVESEKRWEEYSANQKRLTDRKAEMRAECESMGTMEKFWKEYPEEHPKAVAKRKAEDDKYNRQYEAREKRREASGYYDRENDRYYARQRKLDRERNEPGKREARAAGASSADKINLQPFIGDGKPKTKGNIG